MERNRKSGLSRSRKEAIRGIIVAVAVIILVLISFQLISYSRNHPQFFKDSPPFAMIVQFSFFSGYYLWFFIGFYAEWKNPRSFWRILASMFFGPVWALGHYGRQLLVAP